MARIWLPVSRAHRGWDDLQTRALGRGSALAARSGEASRLGPGKSLEAKDLRHLRGVVEARGALCWVQAAAGRGSLLLLGGSAAGAGHGCTCSGSMVALGCGCTGDSGWAPALGAPQACASL